MALAQKTFFSLGGPTYIPDARVDEAIRMGELLSKRQALAQDANDRLFARNQSIADAQERRRQFDAVQGRYAETAQREAADRKAAMERAIFDSDRSYDASREDTAAQRAQAAAFADREFGLRQTAEQRAAADMAADNERATKQFDYAQERDLANDSRAKKERADDLYFKEIDRQRAERLAREAEAANERRFNATRTDRTAEQIAERAHQKELLDFNERKQSDAEKRRDQKIETERAKALGTDVERRAAAVTAQVARFRMALDEATAKGDLHDADQAKAVRKALDAAKFPSVAADDIRREAVDLGPEGEAEAEAEFRRIVEEKFPKTFRFAPSTVPGSSNGGVVSDAARRGLAMLLGGSPSALTSAAPNLQDLPVSAQDWLGRNLPDGLAELLFRRASGGAAEADKLFTREPKRPERRRQ